VPRKIAPLEEEEEKENEKTSQRLKIAKVNVGLFLVVQATTHVITHVITSRGN